MKSFVLGIILFLVGAFAAGGIFIYMHRTPQPIISPLTMQKTPEKPTTNFSLENAPSQSLRGTITLMEGDIFWQSRIATEPAKLIQAINLQQGEKLVTGENGWISVDFDGAASVKLLPDSDVEIVQTLPLDLVFSQIKGITEFISFGQIPVSVRSLKLLTTLQNGSFQLSANDKTHVVTVKPSGGQVKVAYNDTDFVSQVFTLGPGDIFVFDSDRLESVIR